MGTSSDVLRFRCKMLKKIRGLRRRGGAREVNVTPTTKWWMAVG